MRRRSTQHQCVNMSYFCVQLLRSLSEGEPRIKRSHLIGTLVAVSMIILVGTTLFNHHEKDTKCSEACIVISKRDICTTDICKAEAFRIKSNTKESVNPCDNFYEFACGGWEDRHPLRPGDSSWNQFKETGNITAYRVKEILEKDDKNDDIESIRSARKFYRTCVATFANIQPSFDIFLQKLSKPGGWPSVSDNWESDKFDWQSLIVELERTTKDVSPLFKIDVVQDPKNSSRFVLHLAPSSSPDLCIEFRKIESLDGLPLYHPWTATAHLLSNITTEKFPDSSTKEEDDDTKALKFAKKFCEITKKKFKRTYSDPYPSTALSDFQAMTDGLTLTKSSSKVDWTKLLKQYVNGSDVEFTEDNVIIIQSDVILDVIKLIDVTPERTLANYIYLNKVRWVKSFYSEEAVSDRKSQEESCVLQTQEIFPHAIGREYVRLHFTEDDLTEVTNIMQQILSFSSDIINDAQWMDSKTRATASDKADHMVYIVGYPQWYKDTSKIDEMYSKIQVGDSHIENLESSRLGDILFRLKFLRGKVDQTLFVEGAAELNAAYSHNLLYVPAGMIQPPFYVRGRPAALNFGSLVSIIAHEITHAFDIDGRQRDKHGNAVNWWSTAAFKAYMKKAECFYNQYNRYYIHELESMNEKHRQLDGFKTLSENLADNGGLETAFEAYQHFYKHLEKNTRLPGLADYTPQQLFFIGYASNWCESSSSLSILSSVLFSKHSPSKYRILIPLTNSVEFARAWDCQSGLSNMSNKPRCNFWTPHQLQEKPFLDFKSRIDATLLNDNIQKINQAGISTETKKQ